MIYHYKDIPAEVLSLQQLPAGYDITINLMSRYRNNPAGLAVAALNIGYYIGMEAGKENNKNER